MNTIFKTNESNTTTELLGRCLCDTSNSEIPHELIKFAQKNGWIDSIIDQMWKKRLQIENDSKTSCVNNAFAVMRIFLGGRNSVKTIKKLLISSVYQYPIPLNSKPQRHWILRVNNLFDSFTTLAMDQEGFDTLSKAEKKIQIAKSVSLLFEEFVEMYIPLVEEIVNNNGICVEDKIDEIKKLFQQSKFNFNAPIISHLEAVLENNEEKVSEDKSFLYPICLRAPASGQESTPKTDSIECHHICLIEQYYSTELKTVCYRRYQSWLDQIPLKVTSMTKQEVMVFLNDLKSLYQLNPDTQEFVSAKQCFGFENPPIPLQTLYSDEKINILQGLSFRFCSCPFNPQNVIPNFSKMIPSHISFNQKSSEQGGVI